MYRVYIAHYSPLRLTIVYDDSGYEEIRFPDNEHFLDELAAWKHLFRKYNVSINETNVIEKATVVDKELKDLIYKDIKKSYYPDNK